MQSLGATIIRFEFPEYDALLPSIDTAPFEARTVMEKYFATLGPDAPVKSFAQLIAAKTSAVQSTLEAEFAIQDGMNSQTVRKTLCRHPVATTRQLRAGWVIEVVSRWR